MSNLDYLRGRTGLSLVHRTIQFYDNSHNSQSDRLIGLKVYIESPNMLSYLGLKFQINQRWRRHRNTSQQRLHEFCYLLPFDLWTSYLARILFLQGCGSLFWEFPSSKGIFNDCNIISKYGKDSLMCKNPFLIRILYPS